MNTAPRTRTSALATRCRVLSGSRSEKALPRNTTGAFASSMPAVVAGTTAGMLLANAPVVFLGKAFSDRLPLTALHRAASVLFLLLGALFIYRAVSHTP